MSRTIHVYGAGNAIVDLQLKVSEAEFATQGFEKGTMRLVDSGEQEALLDAFKAHEIVWSSGGSVANSMIALSQLGGSSVFGCLVGEDGFGKFFLEEMDRLGVVLHNGPVIDYRTGTSAILITPDAERTMRTHLGAAATLDAEDISNDYLAQSEWSFIEGYLFCDPRGTNAALHMVDTSKHFNTKVAITASEAFVIESFRDTFDRVLNSTDLLFTNIREAQALTNIEDEEQAFQALKKRVRNCVMTRTEKGAWSFYDGVESRIEGFPVRAIDATGAGDMFAGSFLYGITNGLTPEESTRLACFLSSRVVAQLGARIRTDLKKVARAGGFSIA